MARSTTDDQRREESIRTPINRLFVRKQWFIPWPTLWRLHWLFHDQYSAQYGQKGQEVDIEEYHVLIGQFGTVQ